MTRVHLRRATIALSGPSLSAQGPLELAPYLWPQAPNFLAIVSHVEVGGDRPITSGPSVCEPVTAARGPFVLFRDCRGWLGLPFRVVDLNAAWFTGAGHANAPGSQTTCHPHARRTGVVDIYLRKAQPVWQGLHSYGYGTSHRCCTSITPPMLAALIVVVWAMVTTQYGARCQSIVSQYSS